MYTLNLSAHQNLFRETEKGGLKPSNRLGWMNKLSVRNLQIAITAMTHELACLEPNLTPRANGNVNSQWFWLEYDLGSKLSIKVMLMIQAFKHYNLGSLPAASIPSPFCTTDVLPWIAQQGFYAHSICMMWQEGSQLQIQPTEASCCALFPQQWSVDMFWGSYKANVRNGCNLRQNHLALCCPQPWSQMWIFHRTLTQNTHMSGEMLPTGSWHAAVDYVHTFCHVQESQSLAELFNHLLPCPPPFSVSGTVW